MNDIMDIWLNSRQLLSDVDAHTHQHGRYLCSGFIVLLIPIFFDCSDFRFVCLLVCLFLSLCFVFQSSIDITKCKDFNFKHMQGFNNLYEASQSLQGFIFFSFDISLSCVTFTFCEMLVVFISYYLKVMIYYHISLSAFG